MPLTKPPAVLVYTGGQRELYDRMREQMRHLLPHDKYTVFHILPDALKNQPWMEPTTACLIVLDTKGLDNDVKQILEFFVKEDGKLIFFCGGRLMKDIENLGTRDVEASLLTHLALGEEFGRHMKDLKELARALRASAGPFKDSFIEDIDGVKVKVELKGKHDAPNVLMIEKIDSKSMCVFSDASCDDIFMNDQVFAEYLTHCNIEVSRIGRTLLTSGVLMAQDGRLWELGDIPLNCQLGTDPKLCFMRAEELGERKAVEASEKLLPVILGHSDPAHYDSFDFRRYFSRLSTKVLGRVCLHVPVATTTNDISKSLQAAIPQLPGAVVIAAQQTHGQGRMGTEYISPLGAATFTFHHDVSPDSAICKHLPFMQHIFSVALVDAVHNLVGDDEFPLRIKWPNDFYYRNETKVGGAMLIISPSPRNKGWHTFTIGAGINVSNHFPTTCLNNMNERKDYKFNIEDVIAETMNKFEYWLNVYEQDVVDHKAFMEQYYKYWLHSDTEVYVKEQDEKVKITGLDDDGFLLCRGRQRTYSLSNDGNTFDMMKGLIHMKG